MIMSDNFIVSTLGIYGQPELLLLLSRQMFFGINSVNWVILHRLGLTSTG